MKKTLVVILALSLLLAACNSAESQNPSDVLLQNSQTDQNKLENATADDDDIDSDASSDKEDGLRHESGILISDIPKPVDPPRPWGLSSLDLHELNLIEESGEELGSEIGAVYIDDNTIVLVTTYKLYNAKKYANQPINTVAVYEYKIAEKQLKRVFEEYVGSEDDFYMSSFSQVGIKDEHTIVVTDFMSYIFELSLPDYKRVDNFEYDENGIIILQPDWKMDEWVIKVNEVTGAKFFGWSGLELDEDDNFTQNSYKNEAETVAARLTQTNHPDNQNITDIDMIFEFADGRNELVIPVDRNVEIEKILEFNMWQNYFTKDKPYFVAIIPKMHNQPENLTKEMSAHLYWIENVLLIVNYETGEYMFTDPINGLSSILRVTFNSDESEMMLSIVEFDQLKSDPNSKINGRCYSYVYTIDIEEFIKNNKNGGFFNEENS